MSEEIDLFKTPDLLPVEVRKIVEEINKLYENGDMNYNDCKEYQKKFEAVGYTYDYYLDAVPFNLRKVSA